MLTSVGPVLTEGVSLVWELVTGNPLLTLSVGCGVAGMGFRFFRKARRVAG